ncbi:FAD-dependent monooxygenase [Nocardioides sp. NPDC006303]|uniref:FAD-dependent monooxygenase n=1 Tax=Nocardioides sp. NPDC006303 TaxID=3156747 RepID=UPI0033ABA0F6
MKIIEVHVLVVGAGVTGLILSVALADHRVNALTIAKHPGTAPQPRAHITNQRAVEVLRDLGLEEAVKEVAVPLSQMNHNVLATSFAGRELYRYQAYGTGHRTADYHASSPCPPLNAPQHVLEPVLLDAARKRGADVRFSNELLEVAETENGVVARCRDVDTGEQYEVHARYVVGADGGRSRVAEQFGFEFEGQAGLRHMVNAWIETDLTQYTAHRPGVIYTLMQPGSDSPVGSGTFVCVRPWDDWMLVREYDPSTGDPDTSDEAITFAVRTLVGDDELAVRVKGISKWEVNQLVATTYRHGRAFIAGDAAHRHPPSGGLGSNTCIQDAWNLAWKLAFVTSGRAAEDLLDSYEQERQPVGADIVERAITNLMNQVPTIEALGLRRDQSTAEGWASLNQLTSDEDGAEERRERLRDALFLHNYRSNAQGVELGHRYTSGAVVDDGTPFPEYTRDPLLYYHPTTHPGGYLPHAWIEHERRQISTLDLAGHGRFCLIVGIGGEPWAEAAAEVSEELGVELPVYSVGYRCEYDDVVGDWARLREVSDRGALLVRPDRVIGWRAADRSESPAAELRAALHHILATGAKVVQSEKESAVTSQ